MSTGSASSACPACSAAPLAMEIARGAGRGGDEIVLSLPTVHCAACIGAVESGLMKVVGVNDARVNLSRKRVSIAADPDVTPDFLITALDRIGFDAQELDAGMMSSVDIDSEGQALLRRVAVAGFAMMNVMLFSVAIWSGATDATRTLFYWLSAAISVPAILYSAQVFFWSALGALKGGRLNMDVPISLAIILATGLSIYETSQGTEHAYFDAAMSLTFFLLIGRYLDHRARMAARSAAQELSALEVQRATRIRGDSRETVSVADLEVGDTIAVPVGMRLPVDGVLLSKSADLDRAILTGESLPAIAQQGDVLAAGEINLSQPIKLRATAVGQDTTLRRMAALVETAETGRTRYTALADRAARVYAPLVHLLALCAFVGWYMSSGDIRLSLNIAISVLIITCPCALGLAAPAVLTAAANRMFRKGFLVKSSTALERLSEVDTVVFDKTGTLTAGLVTLDFENLSDETTGVLAALTRDSEHPVSRIIAAALPRDLRKEDIDDISEFPGLGLQGIWKGKTVRLGRGDWVGADASPALQIGDKDPIVIPMSETLRDGAKSTVNKFAAIGFEQYLFSGDEPDAVKKIARDLNIADARARMTPQDKCDAIASMQADGAKVLMVGDGLNDTASLAQAWASISPASALDAARTASDMVLLGDSVANLPDAVRIATSARRRVLENFGIAASYNAVAIPLALMGYATPLSAALAMSLSSITVLLNALRVR